MDALILSCGTGGGHNAACAALAQALSDKGHRADQLNPFSLKSAQAAAMVDQAYNALVQHVPSAFGMMYQLGNAYRKLPVSSPVYHANHLIAPLLLKHIEAHSYQAIVTTHLFPAEMLTVLKRGGHPLPPTFFIATDYTCIPFTEETDLDWYVIPSKELTSEFVARGIPEERILPLGIPVQRAYYDAAISREEARTRLGLAQEERIILVAGGCVGAGQLETVVSLLLQHYGESARIIVVCGRNESLYTRMRQAFDRQCTLIQYTNQMADYIRACDLFLSKPGGLSSTEAAVLGTALIHITPIPGCENHNMAFFAQRGMCLPVNDLQKELPSACEQLMDEAARAQMCACQRAHIPQNAAKEICRFIEHTCNA